MHQLVIHKRINCPAESLYSHFQEFEKFGALHPFFTRVTKTAENIFFVNERVLLFGFLPMEPQYSVEVHEMKGAIRYLSEVRKNVKLEINFSFEEKDHYTDITEVVTVKTNRIIAMILLNTIEKAHSEIFRKLEKLVTKM